MADANLAVSLDSRGSVASASSIEEKAMSEACQVKITRIGKAIEASIGSAAGRRR
jgi:hypothetical protein